jgi:very-short-patch-repair endonuclease
LVQRRRSRFLQEFQRRVEENTGIAVDWASTFRSVECDGHNFHERTKEQASHDKQRDRRLAAAGITTLRFTGSDIYNRLDQCIDEIQDYLVGKIFRRELAA